MPKFKVEVLIDYDGIISVEKSERPKSQSHINEIMKDDLYAQVEDALTLYGFPTKVTYVRKVQK